jgi:threonine dehydrogenase-like Zn-dependent dehydrogenase
MSADPPPRTQTRSGLSRRKFITEVTALAVATQQAVPRLLAQDSVHPASPTTKAKRSTTGTKTMRALFAGGGGPPHFQSIAAPRLETDLEAIVRPLTVSLCDLDVAYISNRLATQRPYAVGHEFTAEVVEIGSAVQTLKPGDRVILPFQISCGGCSRCRAGRSLDCTRVEPLSAFGLEPFGGGARWGGACADLVKIPFADAMALKLPAGTDLVAMASLSDNVVDGYRCIAPHVRPGDGVLVIGSGSIGLYATAVASSLRVPCTYVDSVDARLRVAERFGAKLVTGVPDGKSFGEFAVVACCNSTPEGLQSAIRSTTGGGICQIAGLHIRPVDLPLVEMYRRGLRLAIGRSSARDDLPAVLELIQQKRLKPGEIGATVVDVGDAPRVLREALSHKTIIKLA